MNKIVLVLAFTLFSLSGLAQKRTQDNVRALKVAFLTTEMNLSSEQSEKFWPVYNKFTEERRQIIIKIRQLNKSKDNSDDDILEKQDDILELRQKELTLEKKYRDDFLKVISVKQYGSLKEAEKKFNQKLLEKLKENK